MPLDPAQRHQIDQDAITAISEAKRLAACDDAIALLREIANQETDDDGNVILGTEARSSNDLMSRHCYHSEDRRRLGSKQKIACWSGQGSSSVWLGSREVVWHLGEAVNRCHCEIAQRSVLRLTYGPVIAAPNFSHDLLRPIPRHSRLSCCLNLDFVRHGLRS